MQKLTFILSLLVWIPLFLSGQDINSIPEAPQDSVKSSVEQKKDGDAILKNYSEIYAPKSVVDTTQNIYYWRITKRTGEIIPGKPDTLLTDFPNRTTADGMSVAMAHLGNLGLPMESRIYFDRPDRSYFMFADPYYNYAMTPEKHDYINTKIPYSNLTYQSGGSGESKEERMLGALSINFGKHLNLGFDIDYLYARGFYNSQSAKRMDWNFYGSYIADRHQVHALVNPTDYTNEENGGIADDRFITDPTSLENQTVQNLSIPVRFQNVWNRQKGMEYYLSYHYNLGFEKDSDKKDEDGDLIKQFIPVSSIIYTFDYIDKSRKFNSKDTIGINNFYDYRDNFKTGQPVNDSTSYWAMSNTLGLSMREGFSQWAKFDLTGFITQENRRYTMIDSILPNQTKIDTTLSNATWGQQSTYIGGEIAKRTGKILRYDAQANLGLVGANQGDYQLAGKIETRIPFLKDTASITAQAYMKQTSPTFYENQFHGKYFWWDKDFEPVKKQFIGGAIDIPHTKTNLSIGVENVTNYLYFDKTGNPNQEKENIQIMAVTLQQNLKLGALHWNNQLVYQTSSKQDIIPLPEFSLYSNLYVQFLVAKVLTFQIGGNVHYFSKYNSPTYEPATQQFRLQSDMEIGEYPLINGFVNCHLKYTRFFIEFYNLSASFISPPEYFSAPHYPMNPQIFKFGLSWDFHN